MMSTRSLRASGGRTPGTTWCFSGAAKSVGGSGGGTCAACAEAAADRPSCAVVCMRLTIAISLAVTARLCAWLASSSAAALDWMARLSESKNRFAGSRFWFCAWRTIGCVTSIWRARTTSAWSASSSSAETKLAVWKTVAMGETMLPPASGGDLKKISALWSWR